MIGRERTWESLRVAFRRTQYGKLDMYERCRADTSTLCADGAQAPFAQFVAITAASAGRIQDNISAGIQYHDTQLLLIVSSHEDDPGG